MQVIMNVKQKASLQAAAWQAFMPFSNNEKVKPSQTFK
jgi:hypothetical protein